MATESNAGFRHEEHGLGSSVMMNRHAISFQSGAMISSSEMIPIGNYYGASTSTSSMILPGNSSMNVISTASTGLLQPGNSSSSLLVDSVPGLKHDAGFAAEWSAEEQYLLDAGLEKYKDEPSIMRYIKIAATLRDKTVRDVALRCRWLTRKRRKAEEQGGKKFSNRKDKLGESSLKMKAPLDPSRQMMAHPLLIHQSGQNQSVPGGFNDIAINLLEQNDQAFRQITANLSMYKLQDNIDLFCQTRNNITAILNDMSEMPGIMSQMPALPVSLNEDLVNNIMSHISRPVMFGLPGSSIHLKQEPRS